MTLPLRPHVAAAVLGFVLPRQDVEVIIGDLEEEDVACQLSSGGSSRWYWLQIARSLPSLIWLPISRDGWRSTFAVAFGACVVQIVIEVTTAVAMRELSSPRAQWPAVLALVLTLASLALVSYTAVRIRAGAGIALAGLASAAIILRLALDAHAGVEVPLQAVAVLLVAPATVIMGGRLSLRTRQP